MSVIQGTKEEGSKYISDNVEYTFDNVECIVNQKQNHSNGTLYLTQEYNYFTINL